MNTSSQAVLNGNEGHICRAIGNRLRTQAQTYVKHMRNIVRKIAYNRDMVLCLYVGMILARY